MRCSVLIAAWLGGIAPIASLQAQSPISFGVGGGISLPQGDMSDAVDTGWNALVTAELGTPMNPWALRLDLAYNRFAFNDEARAVLGENQTAGSATFNFTYRLPRVTSPIQPYLLLGLGAYRTDCSVGCDSRVRYGWNYGLGAKFYFLGLRNFIEIRGHRTKSSIDDVHYFPLTLGIML